jgi:hypothetical protein
MSDSTAQTSSGVAATVTVLRMVAMDGPFVGEFLLTVMTAHRVPIHRDGRGDLAWFGDDHQRTVRR